MRIEEFDYELPPERIAQWPLAERDLSRLLVLERQSGAWQDRQFRDFPEMLRGDELVVLNNARVIPARLFGLRKGLHAQRVGKRNPARHEHLRTPVEVLLMKSLGAGEWEVLVRPGW